MRPLNGTHDIAKTVIRKIAVLPALQNEGAKSEGIAFDTAINDFVGSQSVSVAVFVAFSDAAVITVILTDVADFNQTSDKNLVTVNTFPCGNCFFGKICGCTWQILYLQLCLQRLHRSRKEEADKRCYRRAFAHRWKIQKDKL